MDRKQKERLRYYLKARKRADKVLAQRRAEQLKKLDHDQRLEANQALMEQYTQELTALAKESGLLASAEQAALLRGGCLAQQVSYYIDYGLTSNHLQRAYANAERGALRASHLSLRIRWGAEGAMKEAEVRVHKRGYVTFHNSLLPVFSFIWRRYPIILQKMLASALANPRTPAEPVKEKP